MCNPSHPQSKDPNHPFVKAWNEGTGSKLGAEPEADAPVNADLKAARARSASSNLFNRGLLANLGPGKDGGKLGPS